MDALHAFSCSATRCVTVLLYILAMMIPEIPGRQVPVYALLVLFTHDFPHVEEWPDASE